MGYFLNGSRTSSMAFPPRAAGRLSDLELYTTARVENDREYLRVLDTFSEVMASCLEVDTERNSEELYTKIRVVLVDLHNTASAAVDATPQDAAPDRYYCGLKALTEQCLSAQGASHKDMLKQIYLLVKQARDEEARPKKVFDSRLPRVRASPCTLL